MTVPVFVLVFCVVSFEDSPLSVADLEAYHAALGSKTESSAPLVQFRDLWDRPEAFVGKQVTVEGRVSRIFRQPRLGEFPPLVEAWIVTTVGDPFCLVFPDAVEPVSLESGQSVQLTGTFLKKVQYQARDVARVAPLIVGPDPPRPVSSPIDADRRFWSRIDWIMGIGCALVLVTILAVRHWSAPVESPRVHPTHPIFIDGDPDSQKEGISDEASV
jgi:hypothetical protein